MVVDNRTHSIFVLEDSFLVVIDQDHLDVVTFVQIISYKDWNNFIYLTIFSYVVFQVYSLREVLLVRIFLCF